MAILDNEKIDFLWKKIIFGVTKTAGAALKFGSNETIASPSPVLPSTVWQQGDEIPATPVANAFIRAYAGAQRLRMSNDPTAPANIAWLATSTFGDLATRQKNLIAPTFGSGYAVKVFIGDPNVGPAARIFPDTTDEEWVFDYAAGVLIFTGTIPAGKTATIGNGSVSVASHGVYIEAFQYIGETGVGSGSGTPEDLGTMAFQNAEDIDVSGGRIAGVTLTNVKIDGGTF